jgi:MFS family permease
MPPQDSLLRHRSFVHFWFGRLATTTGNQMMMVAVAWQMYELTGSPMDLGLVGLAQFLPSLALTLVVGQVADRFDRRLVLALCVALQMLVGVALTWASLGGWVSREVILGASVALGVSKAFQMPTQQALAPLLVPAEMLPRALALSSSGAQFGIMVGPAIGGFLFVGGAQVVYVVCAALFLAASVLFTLVRIERESTVREPITLKSIFAGINFILHRNAVLGAISLDLFAVLLGGATALLPIFAKDILHTGPWGLGLLRSAPAVGGLTMSIWLAHHPIERRVGKVMFASVAVFGVATLVFALSRWFMLSLGALTILGASDMISVVIRQSLVQLDTPNAMRGRVSAVNAIFIGASNQLGEFESGATAAWWGTVPSVVVGGVGTLAIVALWMRLFPDLARREKLTAPSVVRPGLS